MESDELKAGSADSENGSNNSDNSYVQVSREDAQQMDSPQPQTDSPQLLSTGMPDFEETIYEDPEPEPVQVWWLCP